MKEIEASKRKAIWKLRRDLHKHQWAVSIDPIATFEPLAEHTDHT